jgi:hypothetical protein
MAPTVGRIVLVIVDPDTNNGSEIAPAIITRVWSGNDERATVNYRILGEGPASEDDWKSSAQLFANEQAARAAMVKAFQDGAAQGYAPPHNGRTGMFAFWPPRS